MKTPHFAWWSECVYHSFYPWIWVLSVNNLPPELGTSFIQAAFLHLWCFCGECLTTMKALFYYSVAWIFNFILFVSFLLAVMSYYGFWTGLYFSSPPVVGVRRPASRELPVLCYMEMRPGWTTSSVFKVYLALVSLCF